MANGEQHSGQAHDPVARVRHLNLTDPAGYTTGFTADWLRWTPAEADALARDGDERRHREYADHSCDLTMRGGTTSGVIYPLAVCSLARHYVFRSVGGASAGAIAAAATAAAEYGRLAEQPETVTGHRVRPGFAGLAELVDWMISGSGSERWRLVQLFQPNAALSRVFRVLIATMQSPETTGRKRIVAVLTALLAAVSRFAGLTLLVLFAGWVAGPALHLWVLAPSRWNAAGWPVVLLTALPTAFAATWVLAVAAGWLRRGALVLATPLLIGAVALALWGTLGPPLTVRGWLVGATAVTLCWLLTTFTALAAFAVIYARASWPVLTDARRFRFGIVPGAMPYTATWLDRLAGLPRSTGVPPLATWLADRIDDLAGLTPDAGGEHPSALTFGDLWRGPLADPGAPEDPARLREMALRPAERVINLALMSTDLSAGRPYRLPFLPGTGDDDRWQFCPSCLDGIVPGRVVRQLLAAGPSTSDHCPTHRAVRLHRLPEPWDLPVVLAVRMSLSLPGLICPVPLYKKGRQHWFSDGGITSNFPIHFFDTLLPRWPTFGLNLQTLDRAVRPGEEVFLPRQDATGPTVPWAEIGAGAGALAGRILHTFLGWRDTMQAALPGFRGRIAHVRQGLGEGGTNLFMPPEVIAALALRGYEAGEVLRRRFTDPDEGAPGFTQTDRYRWIRMRLALREYRELARQARARGPLYKRRAAHYCVPEELACWFADPAGPWPREEPYSDRIEATFDQLAALADTHLAEPFDGTAPVNPVLRLTPPE
ncbi:Patatin-like phospholipase [Amycolatopsis arida]|uniref:Patatin-like phospholipase n=1 Tax=Amycolatopsis arida TaxID=587909 RepID=A0A1I5LSL5_9PSEU|nr:patatin-like phospholipase family protein [Amycolatopsis arida]TDX93824.1 patatin-like phospholipase [Amycolatopsis arida]SFP00157.1 Patatin-like phospholipase [Amycolatopsis arida]